MEPYEAVDPSIYSKVGFEIYGTLAEKIQALLLGEIVLIKSFEQNLGRDVLVRLEQKKFLVTQISYDIYATEDDPRYWTLFNIGINDLSLMTVYKFEEDIFSLPNKFQLNDVVYYVSQDGLEDSAIIEEVHISSEDPLQFAYKLSRDTVLYAEHLLVKHKYL